MVKSAESAKQLSIIAVMPVRISEFERNDLTSKVELEKAMTVLSEEWNRLARARCQLINNSDDGVSLTVVPRSSAVTIAIPNCFNITPSSHAFGIPATDPFLVQTLTSQMIAACCDSRVYLGNLGGNDNDMLSWRSDQEMLGDDVLLNRYPLNTQEFSEISRKVALRKQSREQKKGKEVSEEEMEEDNVDDGQEDE